MTYAEYIRRYGTHDGSPESSGPDLAGDPRPRERAAAARHDGDTSRDLQRDWYTQAQALRRLGICLDL